MPWKLNDRTHVNVKWVVAVVVGSIASQPPPSLPFVTPAASPPLRLFAIVEFIEIRIAIATQLFPSPEPPKSTGWLATNTIILIPVVTIANVRHYLAVDHHVRTGRDVLTAHRTQQIRTRSRCENHAIYLLL